MREPSVSGLFYEADKSSLQNQVNYYLSLVDVVSAESNIQALIVPHAGYVYSGQVAAAAYKQVEDKSYNNVFIIGTSHQQRFKGAALYSGEAFDMPFGAVPVNQKIVQELVQSSGLIYDNPIIHSGEHTLEVQLPFLQTVLKSSFNIVPILVGTDKPKECEELAGILKPYFTPDNLFVISTDFSHYPNADDAQIEDEKTADAIMSNNPEILIYLLAKHKESHIPGFLTGLCGWTSVLTLLYLTEHDKHVKFRHLLYQNSGDKEQENKHKVVGYHAIAVCVQKDDFVISDKDKELLLSTAHRALEGHWNNTEVDVPDRLSDTLNMQVGAFVSVYYEGKLRGCIGHFETGLPLYQQVQKLVTDAALFDSRFEPIKEDEVGDVKIEISVLTPLRHINNIEDIELGKHGIYIKKGFNKGTFLPQVGARNNWTVEEYLGYCARDKARIGWDGWRDADIYVYEALIFSDKE